MSDAKWTASQLEAINAGEGNFLVAAGAGSGKTAVLTERVFRLVKDHEDDPSKGASLNSLLVLTFTNKAAAEMKDKVRKKIMAEPRLSHLSGEVEGASIMTFDAFAHELVSRYHYAIGVSGSIDVADASVFEVERNRLLDEILEERYAAKDPVLLSFVSAYCVKDDATLRDFVLEADGLGDLKGDKESFFEHYDESFFSESHIAASLREFDGFLRDNLRSLCEAALSKYANPDQSSAEADYLNGLLAAQGLDPLLKALRDGKYPAKIRAKAGDEPNDDALFHGAIAKRYGKIAAYATSMVSESEIRSRYLLTKPYIDLVVSLAHELSHRLSIRKKEAGMYSFSDIATMAREIVMIPEIGEELRAKYRYVMIDEYQDTSDLQESFIAALTGGKNVFAVGDIKQSIYLFRNANPLLFATKRSSYEQKKGGELITLAENFRSREEILKGVNAIFEPIMTKGLGGVDYKNKQSLVYGNKGYALKGQENHEVEVFSYEASPTMSQEETEARLIAGDILRKVRDGYKVIQNNPDKTLSLRPVGWGDFAILDISTTKFDAFRKVFLEAGIPLEVTDHADSFAMDVALLYRRFVTLLAHLDEKGHESECKHAYLSIMRSFLYGRKDEELYHDVRSGSYLHSQLFETIRAKKREEGKTTLAGFAEWIIEEFAFLDKLRTTTDIKANYAELRSFVAMASSLDRLGTSLQEYDDYFDNVKNYKVAVPVESPSDSPSAVSLMTIHASKGLEYKVVYVPGEATKFNLSDSKGAFLCDERYGFVMPVLDGKEPQNIFHILMKERKKDEQVSEELRLYYVALTRAEEKLILLAPKPKNDKAFGVASPMCFRDFLSMSSFGHEASVEVTKFQKAASSSSDGEVSFPFREITETARPLVVSRPSKESLEPLDEGALAYGTKLHRYLELTDLKSKDVSWIKDERDRRLIEKVLSLPLFSDLGDAEIYHEYAYYDETASAHGSIDLLIVHRDRALIVDYKSKSIDDPAYEKQVGAYADYVARVTGLPVEKFLLSLSEGRLRALQ